eukprot:Gb_34961 [translate_table: standard]
MKLPTSDPAVATIGDKIYVVVGCNANSSDWVEVYDPLLGYPDGIVFYPTLPWLITLEDCHPNPTAEFNPLFSTWSHLKKREAVIQGIFFACFYGKIRGYDFQNKEWIVLQGIGRHFETGLYKARLYNVGDKLCAMWLNEHDIKCVCFDIQKYPGRLRGNVLWLLLKKDGALRNYCLLANQTAECFQTFIQQVHICFPW